MKIHYVQVSAYAKTEQVKQLKDCLNELIPEGVDLVEEELKAEKDAGVFNEKLTKLKATVKKQTDIREISSKVFPHLDEYDKRRLAEKTEEYVDSDCNLFIRLSKTELFEGNMVLESRDCIHLRFKIAAYPASKEKAVEIARQVVAE